MDPTLTDDQAQQENTNKGSLGQGTINAINNLPLGRFKRSLAVPKIAARLAAKGFFTFLASNPWVWIVVGIIILAIVVFIVVFGGFGGAPGAPPQTTTQAPAGP